jgi:tetratricopeptide (TPR) repeat protein
MGDAVLTTVNALRTQKGLPPLEYDEILNKTATERAEKAALVGKLVPDKNRLPALIQAGAYARFALSHEIKADNLNDALETLKTNPVAKSKILHPSITHLGLGVATRLTAAYVTLDFARLVSRIDGKAPQTVLERLNEKRELNSLEPLQLDDTLTALAAKIASGFIQQVDTSDGLIAAAQNTLKGSNFTFGRVTIAFQVASDLSSVVIPERSGDPALAYVGIGVAQGNHPKHESGSVAVAFLLAEPQTAHDASRVPTNLPPPKSAPKKNTPISNASLSDQAWLATLTGNHQKAAKLFEKAFRQTQKYSFLYEAARAYARNGDLKLALKDMRYYATKVEGDERKTAEEMIKRLEAGQSIFNTSEKEQMSTEAKRFFVIGQSLFQKGEWDGAVDAFQQAFKYTPHPEILYNIGLAHQRAGRIGDALDFFEEYQRLVPEATNVDEARQFFEIGVELYRSGRFESASKHFAMAYSFLPFPELVYNLALCYKAMGDKEKAVRFFREYLENELDKKERKSVEKEINTLLKKK